jgi:TIR domain
MASLADTPNLVGFFSYSRADDEGSKGKLSRLREFIQEELRAQLGRTNADFRLWQDQAAIAHGELWENKIKSAVAESVFFIPIITPTAIRSRECKFEFDAFLAREKELGRDNLIFPILYIPVPALEDNRRRLEDQLLSIIHSRQYEDLRNLRHLDAFSSEAVALRVQKFCANIVRALEQNWLRTSSKLGRAQDERERHGSDPDQHQSPEDVNVRVYRLCICRCNSAPECSRVGGRFLFAERTPRAANCISVRQQRHLHPPLPSGRARQGCP